MNNHVKQPSLCLHCRLAVQKLIKTKKSSGAAMYCGHNSVFAIAKAIKGVIIGWTIEGPITKERGKELLQGVCGTVEFSVIKEVAPNKIN